MDCCGRDRASDPGAARRRPLSRHPQKFRRRASHPCGGPWHAAKEQIAITGGKAHLDCLAFNVKSGKLYVFECKRGHGTFDADKTKAIDQRLDNISQSIGAHAISKGWTPASTDLFILSFYGATWKSKYPIHDRRSVATLFEPCIGRFVGDYMEYIEAATTRAYSSELRDPGAVSAEETIFDWVDDAREKPWPDVLFTVNGADFVATESES